MNSMITHDSATPREVALSEPLISMPANELPSQRAARRLLRFGGFTMDTATGAVNWRGRRVSLAVEECELLSVLLRRAGQIVSRERLAAMLGSSTEAVDRRIAALVHALEAEGIQARPRRADGLGYILWR